MRLGSPTLDALSTAQFRTAVRAALRDIAGAPAGEPEELANSMGL